MSCKCFKELDMKTNDTNNIEKNVEEQASDNNGKAVIEETVNVAKNVAKTTGTILVGAAKTVGGFAKFISFIAGNLPLVGGVIAFLLVGSLLVFNPFNWNLSLFGDPQIENTENVVQEVRKITEFTTACYYEETVLKSQRIIKGKEWLGFKTDDTVESIVLTAKCTVRAGLDLSKLTDEDLKIMGDSVSIKLPVPEVFDVITNPSDYKIFEENGDWTHEEIVALQVGGKDTMLNNALDHNILEKANNIGRERIKSLFMALGFRAVHVELSDIPVREKTVETPAEQPAEQPQDATLVEVVPMTEVVKTAAVVDSATVAEVKAVLEQATTEE